MCETPTGCEMSQLQLGRSCYKLISYNYSAGDRHFSYFPLLVRPWGLNGFTHLTVLWIVFFAAFLGVKGRQGPMPFSLRRHDPSMSMKVRTAEVFFTFNAFIVEVKETDEAVCGEAGFHFALLLWVDFILNSFLAQLNKKVFTYQARDGSDCNMSQFI